jgi:hypothetical protein
MPRTTRADAQAMPSTAMRDEPQQTTQTQAIARTVSSR